MVWRICSAPCRLVGRNTGTGIWTGALHESINININNNNNKVLSAAHREGQRQQSGRDLSVHAHGHGDEDWHGDGHRDVLPLHAVVYYVALVSVSGLHSTALFFTSLTPPPHAAVPWLSSCRPDRDPPPHTGHAPLDYRQEPEPESKGTELTPSRTSGDTPGHRSASSRSSTSPTPSGCPAPGSSHTSAPREQGAGLAAEVPGQAAQLPAQASPTQLAAVVAAHALQAQPPDEVLLEQQLAACRTRRRQQQQQPLVTNGSRRRLGAALETVPSLQNGLLTPEKRSVSCSVFSSWQYSQNHARLQNWNTLSCTHKEGRAEGRPLRDPRGALCVTSRGSLCVTLRGALCRLGLQAEGPSAVVTLQLHPGAAAAGGRRLSVGGRLKTSGLEIS
ncbi:hypothetical protein EYF80_028906 [Liparis tanakae]|uniref:Uncharacterized protein n=1 Tax=Liparis tanakae TaxID=230148 RepID=A0A4Z2H5K1_9TELE|nr:hypothetical protein EYF80_028906 [Liparis tanakae]